MSASCTIGSNGDGSTILWQPDQCHNPHLIVGGSSGSGKTYTLREIINALSVQNISFTVIDKHGDFDGLDTIQEFCFRYGFKRGINPLSIEPGIEYGGPQFAALSFASLINEVSGVHKLGPEQNNMLNNAIADLYRANGIKQEAPDTWRQEKYPDLNDLARFLMHKYKKILIGAGSDKDVDSLYKKKKHLEKLEKAAAREEDVGNEIEETITTLVSQYEAYLRKGLLNDRDFLIYTNAKSLLGIKNRIEHYGKVGVFVKDEISLKNARLNIKYLEDEQKKIVVYYVLKRLLDRFSKAAVTKKIRHYIVIDECAFFLEISKIKQQIKKIVQEGRKFGLGVIMATQNPLNFDEDILLNSASKMIFSVEPVIYKNMVRSFGVDAKVLSSMRPRVNCLFSTKTNGNGGYKLVQRI